MTQSQQFRHDCPYFHGVFSRMESLGFEFEVGIRPDGLDWLITRLHTDPAKAAEVAWHYAEFTGVNVAAYTEMLPAYLESKVTVPQ